jgi:predicted ATPase
MVEKLKRLSGTAQTALQQLACFGNVVEIASLSLAFGESEEAIHTSLLEAVRTGLILRLDGSYAFLHDHIQEAAYALIPEGDRAGARLGIGRVQLATMSEDQLDEHLFDVANQLNRGAGRLADRNEKAEVATFTYVPGERPRRQQPMRRRARISQPAWRCWTSRTRATSTS